MIARHAYEEIDVGDPLVAAKTGFFEDFQEIGVTIRRVAGNAGNRCPAATLCNHAMLGVLDHSMGALALRLEEEFLRSRNLNDAVMVEKYFSSAGVPRIPFRTALYSVNWRS
jgi:hypothetical protein